VPPSDGGDAGAVVGEEEVDDRVLLAPATTLQVVGGETVDPVVVSLFAKAPEFFGNDDRGTVPMTVPSTRGGHERFFRLGR
jgi:hypothetical protein